MAREAVDGSAFNAKPPLHVNRRREPRAESAVNQIIATDDQAATDAVKSRDRPAVLDVPRGGAERYAGTGVPVLVRRFQAGRKDPARPAHPTRLHALD
jgi:hypothetical protein